MKIRKYVSHSSTFPFHLALNVYNFLISQMPWLIPQFKGEKVQNCIMIIGAVIRSVALICFVPDFDASVFKQLLYYFHVLLAKMHAHVIICHGKSQQELCAPCIYS